MKRDLLYLLILFLVPLTHLHTQPPIVQQIIDSVKIDSLIFVVKELSGEVPTMISGTSHTILSRHRDQPGNALAETYIKQKLISWGFPVTIQNYSSTGNNVLATQVGTVFPNKKFIICAHYDSMPEGTIAPGADDNASGTAAVLEAARILRKHTFPYTVVYALWDEEEILLDGSRYYVRQAAAAGDSILGVLNLDNIAWDSNNDGKCIVQKPATVHSVPIFNTMVEIVKQYGIGLTIVPGYVWDISDHSYFLYNGYDAVHLQDHYYDDYNRYNHTTSERVQYFNNQYYLNMVKLSSGTLAFLAMNLNFDIVHTPIPTVIPAQAVNTELFIYTGRQVGTSSRAPRMYYRTRALGGNYGNFAQIIGTPTSGRKYGFAFPKLPSGTEVQYYLAAQDENSTTGTTSPPGGSGFSPPGSMPPATFYGFLVADLTVVWSDSANSLANWTTTGGWNITGDKYVSPPTSYTDSPGGSPPPFAVSGLSYYGQIPGLNSLKTFLEFDTQWAMEYGWYYAQVEISTNDGATWVPLNGQYTYLARYPYWSSWEPYYGGVQSTWVHEIMDISDYAQSPFKFRFTTQCEAVSMDGWYIDNVKISALVNTKGAMITMDVRTVDLGRISKTTSRYDTTFIVRNIGFAADSLVVSVDPGNVVPDTAVSVLPAIFTLAPGDSQEVTFSIDPSLLAPSFYVAQVIVESKHSLGQTKFQKNYEFQVVISSISDLAGIPGSN